jgi:hypothetical protein
LGPLFRGDSRKANYRDDVAAGASRNYVEDKFMLDSVAGSTVQFE